MCAYSLQFTTFSFFHFNSVCSSFTEELFATLIAFIFIYNALNNVYSISNDYKFQPNSTDLSCTCLGGGDQLVLQDIDWSNVSRKDCVGLGGTLVILVN